MRLPLAVCLLSLLLSTACNYAIESGNYVFERRELIQQFCDFEPPIPDVFTGKLTKRGRTVTIELDDPAFRAKMDQRFLVGVFPQDPDRDHFLVSSSFEVTAEVNGLSCLVFTHIDIEGNLLNDRTFSGTFLFTYDRQVEAPLECPASCVSSFTYIAFK
ncbi:hypothetical protein [Vulgatibacter incomptus]|uniref:Lipoprotein n=1 Tax=Vulgatibacter incomptus TaxID=1391653 RepID=A0A0K1P957_9BACT|nr:hypothetical protein [Vulgatibacter incomptus]AKU90055.1 hypothetical protein AKJ08_0442 [Vulgatibacter incomptus]